MNEQREAVVQQLSAHFAADRLTLDELERRLERVYRAQSAAELAELTADLPGTAVATARPVGSHTAVVHHVRTIMGSVERSGAIELPARLEVRAILGNVGLDLREAIFGPYTEISIRAVMGNVEITLPMGVRVENDGDGFLGSYECHVAPGSMPMVGTAPIVRLTGRAVLGNVEVYAASPSVPRSITKR